MPQVHQYSNVSYRSPFPPPRACIFTCIDNMGWNLIGFFTIYPVSMGCRQIHFIKFQWYCWWWWWRRLDGLLLLAIPLWILTPNQAHTDGMQKFVPTQNKDEEKNKPKIQNMLVISNTATTLNILWPSENGGNWRKSNTYTREERKKN